MKLILSLFMVSLLGCCHLSAQQQSLFYYYKGKPISLSVNSQHFLVYADASKISNEAFEKEYRVTDCLTLKKVDTKVNKNGKRKNKT